MGVLTRRIFGVDPSEGSFAKRGFHGAPEVRQRLERVATTFLDGYHAALEDPSPESLKVRLGAVSDEFRGWVYEGAGMGLTVLDAFTPWRPLRRFDALLADSGDSYTYLIHVGAGWAMARLRLPTGWLLRRLDPLLGWLALDGYGFHEGFFHHRRTVVEARVPGRLEGYARRAFDQGLGRSLWFSEAADVERVIARLATFAPSRHHDLWSGVGLAATYAGGVPVEHLERLRQAAGGHRPALAQGAAFAAKARLRGGFADQNTARGAQVLCGLSCEDAAAATDHALTDLPSGHGLTEERPPFEHWRTKIQHTLTSAGVAA
ncbi:MAG: DUF1702 family protein [Acidobacteriota bacterium]